MNSVSDRNEAYIIKTTGKMSAGLLCRILFFGCFFLGIILANTLWKNEAAWIGYLQENSLLKSTEVITNGKDNLMYVLFARLPFWILLVLFGRKLIGVFVGHLFGAWQGFVLGFLLSSFFVRHGVVGMGVFFCMCFPQIIFYFASYFLLYRMIFHIYQQRKLERRGIENERDRLALHRAYVAVCVALTGIFLLGIVVESYVNCFFLMRIPDFIS